MKKMIPILMTLAFMISCSTSRTAAQLKDAKDITFEYSAMTRGSSLSSVVTKKDITVKEQSRGSEKPTRVVSQSIKDWDALIALTEKTDLEKMGDLEVTGKKHQFDGALAAHLTITIDGKEYRSPTFDHGNPPTEIKDITEKILAMSAFEKDKK